jgi:hypothetical protein
MIEELRQLSQHFLEIKNQQYKRYLLQQSPFRQRLSILIGQRGAGKTTTLIQYLLSQVNNDRLSPHILYIQADHFLMGNISLYEIAEKFSQLGGQWVAFDEIHKYDGWSQELKSIYDTFPQLKVIASGSSALQIHQGTHDLSRRAVVYHLPGLSLREYIDLYYGITLSAYTLEEILKNHEYLADQVVKAITPIQQKILPLFFAYLSHGYYPYFREINDISTYYLLIEQNLHTTIEVDLVAIYPHLTGNSVRKIKQLLSFIAQVVPFVPNWQKLKTLLGIGDDRTLKNYLQYLENAGTIRMLLKATPKLSKLETPEKIYLNNSNQMYALASQPPNKGTMRETFFLNMLAELHDVSFPAQGDFYVDDRYFFEIGGKKKGFQQIKSAQHAYLVCDEMEHGIGAKIPLWLFGFLY